MIRQFIPHDLTQAQKNKRKKIGQGHPCRHRRSSFSNRFVIIHENESSSGASVAQVNACHQVTRNTYTETKWTRAKSNVDYLLGPMWADSLGLVASRSDYQL
ncbi:hypothetical protein KIN20_005065 [Parelaphostrongylus tenuis]|uniref:Uncharacterized protein n=1 Tax=Parelaphostrongylus tenuis TaxID=148309 RepID=A0AAD5LZH7_PARTN|nr:hypothetical protein KIN20_005065 [Parelaphostrongylus tenuis]